MATESTTTYKYRRGGKTLLKKEDHGNDGGDLSRTKKLTPTTGIKWGEGDLIHRPANAPIGGKLSNRRYGSWAGGIEKKK